MATPTAWVPDEIGFRRILAFWTPLAATWLMMAVEGPYVAAIIARLKDPTLNLAAYGVAFSFAFIAEAPIIMVMTASNALVADRDSLLKLRRFVYTLNTILSGLVVVAVIPPLFRFATDRVIGLPPEVPRLTHLATALLVLWPAAIGYRRLYHGILVRHHMPRRVAYGTVVRLVSMSISAVTLALAAPIPGACIGSLALLTGVIAEAVASRWMARHVVHDLLHPGPFAPGPSTWGAAFVLSGRGPQGGSAGVASTAALLGWRRPGVPFVMLGKTFKGLTDRTLAWQTEKLLQLEIGRDDYTVYVRPELVVEVAFNDLQVSPIYPGGLALRFARVKRYRPEKPASEADTFATVQRIYQQMTSREPPPRR